MKPTNKTIDKGFGEITLASLKCRNCSDGYVSIPIYPCKSGHLLCSQCSAYRHCPRCSKKFQKFRRTELEEVAERLLKPCVNREHGCKKTMPPDEIPAHQKHCDFQEHMCTEVIGSEGCSWAGTNNQLTQHLLQKHAAMVSNSLKYDFVITDYSQVKQFSSTRLLTYFSQLFVARLVYDPEERKFYGGVQLVGWSKSATSEYRYEFEIGKKADNGEGHFKFIFGRLTHAVSEKYNEYTLSDKCDHLWFHKDIGNFFTDTNDSLKVTVVLKDVMSLAAVTVSATPQNKYGFVPSQYCQHCY